MIVSDNFLRDVSFHINPSFFQNEYIKIVVKWILAYHKQYGKAPKQTIKDIFESEKDNLREADSDMLKLLLLKLSDQFGQQEQQFNSDYLYDQSLKYFEERSCKILADTIMDFIEKGRSDKALDQISKFKKIAKTTAKWVDPFDVKQIRKTFSKESEWLLVMPGDLGEIMRFKRGWLVGITASFKSGKSWFLMEMALQGILNGLKVVFVSLEMDDVTLSNRLYKRFVNMGDKSESYVYPVFDCWKNQIGNCIRPDCPENVKNNIKLITDTESVVYPEYNVNMQYEPCTWCRDNNFGDYQFASWFKSDYKEKITYANVKERIKSLKEFQDFGLWRIFCYPRFSANLSDVKRDLEMLEYAEDFVPDVVIIDYADILAPEDKRVTGVERIDETWKTLGSLSGEKHCLVVTAGQVTRKGIKKSTIEQEDTAEWIGKLAHVDAMFSLNQNLIDKRFKRIRVGMLVHRHLEFSDDLQVQVLQQLSLGQVVLDSEMRGGK